MGLLIRTRAVRAVTRDYGIAILAFYIQNFRIVMKMEQGTKKGGTDHQERRSSLWFAKPFLFLIVQD
jgi:hypothetical protein